MSECFSIEVRSISTRAILNPLRSTAFNMHGIVKYRLLPKPNETEAAVKIPGFAS